ncbi:uncharacterized protein V1516DRAFT_681857 [Lipomyces oligophaga]|uniref:uncharacterized protein n=1 Tax=Lipomyces oligophaga TaxID=45792 RepID=UPI0034CF5598
MYRIWAFASCLAGFLLLQLPAVGAIYADEAGVVDWHIPLFGGFDASKTLVSSDSVLAYSQKGILGSIDALTGNFIWRIALDQNVVPQLSVLERLDSGSVVLAAASNTVAGVSRIYAYSEVDGSLIWETTLEIGAPISLAIDGSGVYILGSTGLLAKLRAKSGNLVWLSQIPKGPECFDLLVFDEHSAVAIIARNLDKGFGYFTVNALSGASDFVFTKLDPTSSVVNFQKTKISPTDYFLTWTLPSSPKIIKVAFVGSETVSTKDLSEPRSFSAFTIDSPSAAQIKFAFVSADRASSWSKTYAISDKSQKLELISTEETNSYVSLASGKSFSISPFKFEITTEEPSETNVRTSISGLPTSSIDFVKCYSSSCFVTFLNGECALLSKSGVAWVKDESLSAIVSSVFVDLEEDGEKKSLAEVLFEEHENPIDAYFHRLARHAKALRDLPAFIVDFTKKFMSGNYDTIPVDSNSTVGDTFGFRKFIVIATQYGGLRALDTAHQGAIAWKMDNVFKGEQSIVQLVKGSAKTELFVISSTGETVLIDSVTGKIVKPIEHSDLELGDKVESAFSTWDEEKSSYAIGLWTYHKKLHFITSQPLNKTFYFSKVENNAVQGYIYNNGTTKSTYTFKMPSGFRISSYKARDPRDITVSLGRVLGDRSVLYKYLNPHLLAISAVNEETLSAAIFLIDDVSGRLLYSAFHNGEDIDVSAGVQLVVGEHWIVYSYWSDKIARGEKIVVLDLYESDLTNERWSTEKFSSFEDTPRPAVISSAFLFPTHITTLAVSRSRFGITNRDIIAALENNQVAVLPKRLLDARRPVNRDPTNYEKEEGLVRYEPLLGDDRRNVISHVYNVIGLRSIETEPAYLESTVLVFGYGIDLFFSRITPSQPFDVLAKSFNKPQLLLTIFALLAGVRITGPMVRRKQTNMRWGSDQS